MVRETKLDKKFPNSQFHMDNFSLHYRLGRMHNNGGVMIFLKEDIPSKLLTNPDFPSNVESLFVEIYFIKMASIWYLSLTCTKWSLFF